MLLLSKIKPKLFGPPIRATDLANSMTVAPQSKDRIFVALHKEKKNKGTWTLACVVRNCYREGNTV